jgi:hypothetical protein
VSPGIGPLVAIAKFCWAGTAYSNIAATAIAAKTTIGLCRPDIVRLVDSNISGLRHYYL